MKFERIVFVEFLIIIGLILIVVCLLLNNNSLKKENKEIHKDYLGCVEENIKLYDENDYLWEKVNR